MFLQDTSPVLPELRHNSIVQVIVELPSANIVCLAVLVMCILHASQLWGAQNVERPIYSARRNAQTWMNQIAMLFEDCVICVILRCCEILL